MLAARMLSQNDCSPTKRSRRAAEPQPPEQTDPSFSPDGGQKGGRIV
jgi:hypothetical protein